MRRTPKRRPLQLLAALSALATPAALLAGTLAVTATQPPRNASNVAPTAAITLRFDRALAPATVTAAHLRAYGEQSGPIGGAPELIDGATAVRLRPTRPLAPGESVLVLVSHDLQAADGSPLRAGGYSYQFSIAVRAGTRSFVAGDTLSVRSSPGTGTRLYGAQATDLDLDGWLDLATMNEDSADLRVLMNDGDGTVGFGPVLTPTTAIGLGASPNEAGDFDADGWPDVAVVNGSESTLSVVQGDGDGTFGPEQVLPTDSVAHGLAVLDVDGDADLDLVAAVYGDSELALFLNDGAGNFASGGTFDSGVGAEWTVTAGDFDEDGLLDLAVGSWSPNEVRILRGVGNGSFAFDSARAAGGSPWMLVAGDLDGDGHLDLTSANSGFSNGGALFGNGDGTLDPVVTVPVPGSVISTDLGDLDGDGDLDWVLASYSSALWYVYANDGAGGFAFDQQFAAPQAGSCALPFDADRDGDLDLALFDELADVILLRENSAAVGILFFDGFEGADATAWSGTVP
jgi:hypothetical protein